MLSQNYGKRLSAPSCLSVCLSVSLSAKINSALWNLTFEYFLKNLRKLQFYYNRTRIGHEPLCTFFIIMLRWNLLRIRNISDKNFRENPGNRLNSRFGGVGQATDGNTVHALCVLYLILQKYRLWNTHCFFHSKNCYTNPLKFYVYRYTACLVALVLN